MSPDLSIRFSRLDGKFDKASQRGLCPLLVRVAVVLEPVALTLTWKWQ